MVSSAKDIPDRVKIQILKSLKDYPLLHVKRLRGDHRTEWMKLRKEVHQITGIDLKPAILSKCVSRTKNTLERKLRTCIVHQKLDKAAVERSLQRWKFYPHFQYYRKELTEMEAEMRNEARFGAGQNDENNDFMDVDEDDYEDDDMENDTDDHNDNGVVDPQTQADEEKKEQERRNKLPCACVISPNTNLRLPRVHLVEKFLAEIPAQCKEAHRAKKLGSMHLSRKYPGIPSRKFTQADLEKYGSDESIDWDVQCLYENKNDPDTCYAYFEGWFIEYVYDKDSLATTAFDNLNAARIRSKFLQSIKDTSSNCIGNLADKWRYDNDWRIGGSMFWDFEDLGYYHSKIHADYGLGLLFYIGLTNESIFPKKYSYTAINIMDLAVFNMCQKSKANTAYPELAQRNPTKRRKMQRKGGCENHKKCVCDHRFELLYGGDDEPWSLKTTSEGLLDLSLLSKEDTRVAIECTNACGCSPNCPRRQSQKGNAKPLVVYYEGPGKEFGLRAAAAYRKGEYIGDYTGRLKMPLDSDDHSYEAGMKILDQELVVCARKEGNFARFMSHSCNPNSLFVEVWTKKFETDPWIPKISVYAARDIELGAEITVAYWTETDLIGVPRSTPCLCNSANCMKMLP